MKPELSSHSHSKLTSYLALCASICFGIAGQLLMKHTMSSRTNGLLSPSFIQQLIIAIATYSLGLVNWIYALKFVKLSIAYPLSSLNYVGILLGSYYFFNERITLMRIFGVMLIFTGVLLVVMPFKKRGLFHE